MIESKSGKARISAPAHLPQRVAVYPALFDQVLEAAKTKEPKIFISMCRNVSTYVKLICLQLLMVSTFVFRLDGNKANTVRESRAGYI